MLGLAAFILRAGVAALTEWKPIFPAYYYHDATFVERMAWDMAETWRSGKAYQSPYSPGQRAHAALLAVPYVAVGRRPLVNKLINSMLGAGAVVLLGLAFRPAFSERAAFGAAALAAAWPSHAFYTSQLFKEAPTLALVYGALALLLPMLEPGAKPAPGRAAAAAALLAAAGLLRAYVPAVLVCALALGVCLALRRASGRAAALFALFALLATPVAYFAAESFMFGRLIAVPKGVPAALPPLAPLAQGPVPAPWTPAGLGRRRAQGQASDRAYAHNSMGRDIASQIEPDARLETWLDLARFMPGAAFQVLFMPLPGLYPMQGKAGRWLAALENIFLLALAAAAAAGLARRPLTPARFALLAFFLAMTAGSAIMEFDLGSASRHKLLYLPMLFPFAAEELLSRKRT